MKPPVVFVAMQSGARANGGLRSLGEVITRLQEHRPILVTNAESDQTGQWRQQGIEVHIVPERASKGLRADLLGSVRTYLRYHRVLTKLLRASGARVIHANDPLAFQLAASPKRAGGARLILNLRDTLAPGRSPPRLKFRAIFGLADHILYLSQDMARRWSKVAANATSRFSVTYSAVDRRQFARSSPSEEHPPIVLVPGIFWAKKGQLEFIRYVVPLLAERKIQCWFAGDFDPRTNDYAAECASAAEPFADHLKFLGHRKDMAELLQRASAIAVPSKHEGLMRGMIEAMSCGRPVVSFDVCSAREVLLEQSAVAGAVVEMGDFPAMADALIRYATDRKAQEAAGRAASKIAASLFDPSQVVERHERIYRELGTR